MPRATFSKLARSGWRRTHAAAAKPSRICCPRLEQMATKPSVQLVAKIIVGLVLITAAWTLIASMVFLFGTRLIGSFAHPFYQWWTYFLYAPPNPAVTLWLKIGAGVASAAVLVFAAALVLRG